MWFKLFQRELDRLRQRLRGVYRDLYIYVIVIFKLLINVMKEIISLERIKIPSRSWNLERIPWLIKLMNEMRLFCWKRQYLKENLNTNVNDNKNTFEDRKTIKFVLSLLKTE